MDIWQVNTNGEVVNRKRDKTVDAVYLVEENDEGEYVRIKDDEGNDKGVVFEYGTIEAQWSRTYKGGVDDIFKVRGDENGRRLFEFFANNITNQTGVEFGWTMTGVEGAKGLDFITTSHQEAVEGSFRRLANSQLLNGYTFRSRIHSHRRAEYPSGLPDLGESGGDIGAMKQLVSILEKRKRPIPVFSIYVNHNYIIYDKNSKAFDFNIR